MSSTWRPKLWVAIIYAFLLPPFGFFYLNKYRLVAIYSFLFLVLIILGVSLRWPPFLIYIPIFLTCLCHSIFLINKYDNAVNRGRATKWWVPLVFGAIFFGAILPIRTFVIDFYMLPNPSSMSPTLEPGSLVYVNKWSTEKTLGRGVVVTFFKPGEVNAPFIKRIIGLPGERIVYRNKSIFIRKPCMESDSCPRFKPVKSVLLKGEKAKLARVEVKEERIEGKEYRIWNMPYFMEDISKYFRQEGNAVGTWDVPEGHYFVMGDNRDNSFDSRHFGFVSKDSIDGVVF